MKTEIKPTVELIGEDGNVFALLGKCTRALKKAGQPESAEALREEVFNSGSYDEALQIMAKYVDIE